MAGLAAVPLAAPVACEGKAIATQRRVRVGAAHLLLSPPSPRAAFQLPLHSGQATTTPSLPSQRALQCDRGQPDLKLQGAQPLRPPPSPLVPQQQHRSLGSGRAGECARPSRGRHSRLITPAARHAALLPPGGQRGGGG